MMTKPVSMKKIKKSPGIFNFLNKLYIISKKKFTSNI